MRTMYIAIMILFGAPCSVILITNVYAPCFLDIDCENRYQAQAYSSPIVISRDSFSPSAKVNILIHAPDFNSNSYAIDTIGRDENDVVISTREASIHYILVETGPDTGDFGGYVILSSTTSTCDPVCGPTDGLLAASGDDAITVSFTYKQGHTISSTSYAPIPGAINQRAIPEFPIIVLSLVLSFIFLILCSKMSFVK